MSRLLQGWGAISREARRRGVARHVVVGEIYRKRGLCHRCGDKLPKSRRALTACKPCSDHVRDVTIARYHRVLKAAGVKTRRKRCGVCGKLGHNSRRHG